MILELSILTFNVWGIPLISKDKDLRMKAIGNELAKGNYDVVSLQEVWSEMDYQSIKDTVEEVLPYAHYFYSGVFGSGLCIFSKYPIVTTLYHSWSVNGYVHRVQHGDWFGGKGVGLCKILVNNKYINIYIAHLHAEYNRDSDDYVAHRVIQAFDTAQFIESTQGNAILQVLAGDLNTEPGDLAYRVLISTSKLRETYCPKFGNIATNECFTNTYTSKDVKESLPNGKRIDYILYRPGDNYQVKVLEYSLPLTSKCVPDETFSYSDHEAVFSKILIFKNNIPSTSLNNLSNSSVVGSVSSVGYGGGDGGGGGDTNSCSDINYDQRLLSNYDSCSMNNKIDIIDNNIDNCAYSSSNILVDDDVAASDDDVLNETELLNKEFYNSIEKSIDICNESLRQLTNDRRNYFLMAIFVTFILLYVIDLVPPYYSLKSLYLLLKVLLSGIILFFICMATLWNAIERNGILAGKLAMEISLKQLTDMIGDK